MKAMEQEAIRNKDYTVENHTPINLIDEEGLIDYTVTLFYRAKISVIPNHETETEKDCLTENTLQSMVADTVIEGYIRKYENGMPIGVFQNGRPEDSLIALVRERLEEILSVRYGAAVDSFDIEKHWLPEAEQQELDQLLHMKELRDPRKAAEALIQAMKVGRQTQKAPAEPEPQRIPEKRQQKQRELPTWVCACGSINRSRFCTECGKSSGRWLCTCGNLNTTPFCPECGSPAKNGTHV